MGHPSHRQREIYDSVTMTRRTAQLHRLRGSPHQAAVIYLGDHTRLARLPDRLISFVTIAESVSGDGRINSG